MSYAESTRVPVARSKAEIERTLVRYGVDEFFYGTSSRGAAIGFTYKGRVIKMNVPIPKKESRTRTGELAWEKGNRRMWRVLLLWIKANLEVVDAGLITFEDVFLAQTSLPEGQSVSEFLQPQIQQMIETGKIPKLLT